MSALTVELDNGTIAQLERLATQSRQSIADWLKTMIAKQSVNLSDSSSLEEGYNAMAADAKREGEAKAWVEGLVIEKAIQTHLKLCQN